MVLIYLSKEEFGERRGSRDHYHASLDLWREYLIIGTFGNSLGNVGALLYVRNIDYNNSVYIV